MRPNAKTWRDRLRDKLREAFLRKLLLSWLLGSLVVAAISSLSVAGMPFHTLHEFLGMLSFWLFIGLLLGLLGLLVYRGATTPWVTSRWDAPLMVWIGICAIGGLVVALAKMPDAAWQVAKPVLLIIGYYALLISVGLGVLYLAVRVVRAAWGKPKWESVEERLRKEEERVERIVEENQVLEALVRAREEINNLRNEVAQLRHNRP